MGDSERLQWEEMTSTSCAPGVRWVRDKSREGSRDGLRDESREGSIDGGNCLAVSYCNGKR